MNAGVQVAPAHIAIQYKGFPGLPAMSSLDNISGHLHLPHRQGNSAMTITSGYILAALRVVTAVGITVGAAVADDSVAAGALRILQTNCHQCHTKAMSMSGLDLSSRESLLRG